MHAHALPIAATQLRWPRRRHRKPLPTGTLLVIVVTTETAVTLDNNVLTTTTMTQLEVDHPLGERPCHTAMLATTLATRDLSPVAWANAQAQLAEPVQALEAATARLASRVLRSAVRTAIANAKERGEALSGTARTARRLRLKTNLSFTTTITVRHTDGRINATTSTVGKTASRANRWVLRTILGHVAPGSFGWQPDGRETERVALENLATLIFVADALAQGATALQAEANEKLKPLEGWRGALRQLRRQAT